MSPPRTPLPLVSLAASPAAWARVRDCVRVRPRAWALLVGLLCLPQLACATGAMAEAMVPAAVRVPSCDGLAALAGSLQLGAVTGGAETAGWDHSLVSDDSLARAVRATLAQQGLLAEPGRAHFQLVVTLVELSQPPASFTSEVHCFMRYRLVSLEDGSTPFDDLVLGSHALDVRQVYYAVERMRLANEGAVRENLLSFMKALCAWAEDDSSRAQAPRGRPAVTPEEDGT